MPRNRKDFLVIGLGRFGESVARGLVERGHEVLAIDLDENIVRELSPIVTHAIQADATDESALESIGAGNFDVAIVAIGDDVHANTLVTLMLKELGVPCVISKSKSKVHGKILKKVGADRVVFPEWDMGSRLANSLLTSNVQDYLELAPNYSIMEIKAKNKWVGQTLAELNFRARFGVNVVAIIRNSDINPSPIAEDEISEGDILVVIGHNDDLEKMEEK